jgi:hypothetical protein
MDQSINHTIAAAVKFPRKMRDFGAPGVSGVPKPWQPRRGDGGQSASINGS